jgi:excisionase family DNA binding protein
MEKHKSNLVIIDLTQWMTQTEAAKLKGCSKQYISELIRKGKVKIKEVKPLGLKLVDRQYFE